MPRPFKPASAMPHSAAISSKVPSPVLRNRKFGPCSLAAKISIRSETSGRLTSALPDAGRSIPASSATSETLPRRSNS